MWKNACKKTVSKDFNSGAISSPLSKSLKEQENGEEEGGHVDDIMPKQQFLEANTGPFTLKGSLQAFYLIVPIWMDV